MKITWENIKQILETLPKTSSVKFAIYAAESVQHLNDDPRVAAAIAAAKAWLADPSEVNCKAASYAYAAGCAAGAVAAGAGAGAYAAGCAAGAVAAGAGAGAYAANASAYAANAAGYAAGAAGDEDELEVQTKILEYLKELYFEALPLEEQTWLVRECL